MIMPIGNFNNDCPYTDDTVIYLLMSNEIKRARGFCDLSNGELYTFAFTSTSKARTFLKAARIKQDLFHDIDLFFKMTIGEFYDWSEQKNFSNSKLVIDPDIAMLDHPLFNSVKL